MTVTSTYIYRIAKAIPKMQNAKCEIFLQIFSLTVEISVHRKRSNALRKHMVGFYLPIK